MSRLVLGVRWLVAGALAYMALWSLAAVLDWEQARGPVLALMTAALALGLVEQEGWERLGRRLHSPAVILRLLVTPLLCTLLAATLSVDSADTIFAVLVFFLFNILLAVLGLMLKDRSPGNLVNLGVSVVSVVIALAVVELLAPSLTNALINAQREAARVRAIASANAPLASVEGAPDAAPPAGSTALTEFVGQPGPGPVWGPLTGWGTNTSTTIHSWMEGVYDVQVEYNSLGFRGPEIPYTKPSDVYRILLLGDSYVEALQVEYADTVYAQLGEMLKDARSPDGRHIEVFGVGATGWGTLQEYLYYLHEGYKFSPDVVIDFFVINDVADNNPAQFYDYRDIDFSIEDDHVEVIQGRAVTAESKNPAKRWLDSLPPMLQLTATAGLIRQLVDPPRVVVGLGGALAGVHPQNYIYVSYPEIEGYSEGWRRTKRAYEIWANEAKANGAQLMVVAVDISAEKITELSTYFRDTTADWIWDIDLPYKRLSAILEPLGVPLIPTRDYYEQYAKSIGKRPFDTLFYPQDWHWNPTGHRVTAQLLAEELRARLGLRTP